MGPARVAVLTGAGVAAVAAVRVWGRAALAVADAAFRPNSGRSLAETPPGRPRVGRVGAGLGDEVVAVIFRGREGSEVEIQCHGGSAAIGLVVDALTSAGAILVEPSAWVRRSAGSRLRADAMLDVARASTLRTAAHLLDQADGAFDRALIAIRADLLTHPHTARAGLETLIGRGGIGLRLVDGWRIALAGRPNVGKSRLLNALVGYSRAIVDPTPGTTRDVVSAATAFEGWPVELADTAGLRATSDPIEAAGVDRARARHRDADLVLVVLDRSEPLTEADRAILADHPGALVVANKADLPGVWVRDDATDTVSAERGDGIDRLIAAIARRIVPDPPGPGLALPFRPSHLRLLRALARAVEEGRADRAVRAIGRIAR